MENESDVRTIRLERDGQVYQALYFVEHFLFAVLDGQSVATSCTTNAYDQTRALLGARILEIKRKQKNT